VRNSSTPKRLLRKFVEWLTRLLLPPSALISRPRFQGALNSFRSRIAVLIPGRSCWVAVTFASNRNFHLSPARGGEEPPRIFQGVRGSFLTICRSKAPQEVT